MSPNQLLLRNAHEVHLPVPSLHELLGALVTGGIDLSVGVLMLWQVVYLLGTRTSIRSLLL